MKQRIKIGLTGPSSTGKSTLARDFALNTGIPFKSVQTADVLQECGYASHADLVKAGLEANLKFQKKLVEARLNLLHSDSDFITDRTPLDSLVYYNMSAMHDPEALDPAWESQVIRSLAGYTLVQFLPFGSIPMEQAERRINSSLYHAMTSAMFKLYIQHMSSTFLGISGLSVIESVSSDRVSRVLDVIADTDSNLLQTTGIGHSVALKYDTIRLS